jgi:hypothetical protein
MDFEKELTTIKEYYKDAEELWNLVEDYNYASSDPAGYFNFCSFMDMQPKTIEQMKIDIHNKFVKLKDDISRISL